MKRFNSIEELISLFPSGLSLVSGVVAHGFERESVLIDKGIHLLFNIIAELFGVGSGLVHIIEQFIDGNGRHGPFIGENKFY